MYSDICAVIACFIAFFKLRLQLTFLLQASPVTFMRKPYFLVHSTLDQLHRPRTICTSNTINVNTYTIQKSHQVLHVRSLMTFFIELSPPFKQGFRIHKPAQIFVHSRAGFQFQVQLIHYFIGAQKDKSRLGFVYSVHK